MGTYRWLVEERKKPQSETFNLEGRITGPKNKTRTQTHISQIYSGEIGVCGQLWRLVYHLLRLGVRWLVSSVLRNVVYVCVSKWAPVKKREYFFFWMIESEMQKEVIKMKMRTASDKLNINRNVHGSSLFYFILFCQSSVSLFLADRERRLGILGLLRLNNCKTWCARTHSEALFKASKWAGICLVPGYLLITLKTKFDEHKMTKQVSNLWAQQNKNEEKKTFCVRSSTWSPIGMDVSDEDICVEMSELSGVE